MRSSSSSISPPTKYGQSAVGEGDMPGALEHGDRGIGVEPAKPGGGRHSAGHPADDDHSLGCRGHVTHRDNHDFRLGFGAAAVRHWHRSSLGTAPSTCSTWAPQPFQVGRPHCLHFAALHIPHRVSQCFEAARRLLVPEGVSCGNVPDTQWGIEDRTEGRHMTASTSTGLGVEPVVSSPESPAVEHDGAGSEPSGGDRPRPFARLGAWAATHFRRVLVAWLLVIVAFGFFAVHVESALAGAGWQASGSQSVAARAIIEKNFAGLGATGLQVVVVDHHGPIATDPHAQALLAKATQVLRSDPRVSTVVPPQAGSRSLETAGPPSSPPERPRTPTRWCRRPTPCSRSWRRCPRPASR